MVKVGGTCQFIDEGGVVNALHGGGGGLRVALSVLILEVALEKIRGVFIF